MTRDFLKYYVSFSFPTPDFLWCLLLFYVIYRHLQHLLGGKLLTKVSYGIIVDPVRSLHRCWNLDPKIVSHTLVFLLQLGNYPIIFAQGERYPPSKEWIVFIFLPLHTRKY